MLYNFFNDHFNDLTLKSIQGVLTAFKIKYIKWVLYDVVYSIHIYILRINYSKS